VNETSRAIVDVTVVIPTLGRPILRRALDALAAGTRLPARVIVVDQGESSEVESMVGALAERGIAAQWLPSAERGRARGVNRGIEASTTRFVAITDDDCLAQPEWVERLACRLEEDPDSIVTGRVDPGDDTVLSAATSSEPVTQRRPSLRFDRLSGGKVGMSRLSVDRIGGLDEDPVLRTAEDAEFAYRALRAGIAVRYAPDVAVTHLGWRDEEAREGQYADYARSHGGFYGKYLRRGDAFIALRAVLHWLRATRRWAANTVRGDRERATAARAYVTGLYAGIRAGWRAGPSR
jgi:GT2 family glycosyltransferase